jgi:hypothetical protein
MNSMACRIVLGRNLLRTLRWSQAKEYRPRGSRTTVVILPAPTREVLTGPPINNLVDLLEREGSNTRMAEPKISLMVQRFQGAFVNYSNSSPWQLDTLILSAAMTTIIGYSPRVHWPTSEHLARPSGKWRPPAKFRSPADEPVFSCPHQGG